jgi:hypothetical protein
MNNEALRLADILEHKIPSIACLEVSAKELRRLHEVNQELIEALKCLTDQIFDQEIIIEWDDKQKALAALAKATGESNEP